MLTKLKKFIRNILNKYFGVFFYRRYSYAQEGEDLVVERLLNGKQNGFYVEVGCHHPYRFSNTFLFYKKGWNGVCIDPLPGTKALFAKNRPRDVCIEMGVDEKFSHLTYYMFNEPALNTFDKDLAESRDGKKEYHIVDKTKVEVRPLADILKNIKNIPNIDILSVDVEGLDLQVLKSNDWEKFAPRIIIAECLTAELSIIDADPVAKFLSGLGYKIYAKTGNSIIFQHIL
jgi:FkbM family methyltransferase